MEKQELIWVSRELAEEYKKLDSVDEQEAIVKKLINKKKLDIEQEQEQLSDSLLQFKSVCLVHKKELGKVYEEQADKLYSLWEETGDVSSMITKHARDISSLVQPMRTEINNLSKDIADLKKAMSELNIYGAERILEVVSKVKTMDEETKFLLKTLLNANTK